MLCFGACPVTLEGIYQYPCPPLLDTSSLHPFPKLWQSKLYPNTVNCPWEGVGHPQLRCRWTQPHGFKCHQGAGKPSIYIIPPSSRPVYLLSFSLYLEVLGWPKSSCGFSVSSYRKTQTNSWANIIVSVFAYLHSISPAECNFQAGRDLHIWYLLPGPIMRLVM